MLISASVAAPIALFISIKLLGSSVSLRGFLTIVRNVAFIAVLRVEAVVYVAAEAL